MVVFRFTAAYLTIKMFDCSSQSKASWAAESCDLPSTYQTANAPAWRRWRSWCVLASVSPLTCYPTGSEEDTGHGGIRPSGGAWTSIYARSVSGSGAGTAVHARTRLLPWLHAHVSATHGNTTSPNWSLHPRRPTRRKDVEQMWKRKAGFSSLSAEKYTVIIF